MRNRHIASPQGDPPVGEEWLDIQSLAVGEVTSEDAAYPIESGPARDARRGDYPP